MSGDFLESGRSLLRRFGEWLQQHPGALDDLQFVAAQLSAEPDDASSIIERVSRAMLPPNWWPLTIDERSRALLLVPSARICLVWAPRAEVVRQLLAADGKVARDAVLIASRPMILEDLEILSRDCRHPMIAESVDAFREAVAAEGADFHRAAQALSASIVTAILAEHYGTPRFVDARARLEREIPGTARLRTARRASVQSVALAAIAQSWSEPRPDRFNRHLTAHGVDSSQYTPVHAIEALLLVGGLLRELQEIYEAGHGGVPSPAVLGAVG